MPSGLFVSNGRMQKDGKILDLYGASLMDIPTFNKEAAAYDVHMDEADLPVDRLVKYAIFISRRNDDDSKIPTNREYVAIILDTVAARVKSSKPLASLYGTLTKDWDVVRDLLEFQETLPKGRYKATLLRFNEDGKLEPVDDIVIAGDGWTRVLDARHGYPVETSRDTCVVENLDHPGLSGRSIKGYWFVGPNSVGKQRLTLRDPRSPDEWLLGAFASRSRSCSDERIGVIRVKGAVPEDYRDKIAEARAERL